MRYRRMTFQIGNVFSYEHALDAQKLVTHRIIDLLYKGELFSNAESLSMAYEYKVNNAQKMLKKSNEILKKHSRNAALRRLEEYFA